MSLNSSQIRAGIKLTEATIAEKIVVNTMFMIKNSTNKIGNTSLNISRLTS